jgi:DnaK suppressor protein
MADKLPKKLKLPKALRQAGLDALLSSAEGRRILAEALVAAARAAAEILTAERPSRQDGEGDAAETAPAPQPKRLVKAKPAAPAERRRVGRPRAALAPQIAGEKKSAPAKPARTKPATAPIPAAARKAAGTPVPRRAAKPAAAPASTGNEGSVTQNGARPSTPGAEASAKPATRRGRPPRAVQPTAGDDTPQA